MYPPSWTSLLVGPLFARHDDIRNRSIDSFLIAGQGRHTSQHPDALVDPEDRVGRESVWPPSLNLTNILYNGNFPKSWSRFHIAYIWFKMLL